MSFLSNVMGNDNMAGMIGKAAGEKVEDIVEGAVGKVMGGGKKETEKSGGGLDSLMSLAGGGGNKEEKSGGGLDTLMSLAGGGGDKNEDKSGGIDVKNVVGSFFK